MQSVRHVSGLREKPVGRERKVTPISSLVTHGGITTRRESKRWNYWKREEDEYL